MSTHASEETGVVALAEGLLLEGERQLRQGRHVQSLLAIARALEVTLAACTATILMKLPAEGQRSTPAEVEMLRKRYMHTIGSMPLSSLRNVVIAMVTRKVHPRSIAEALEFVEQSKRLGSILPSREHFAALDDDEMRSTMEALRDCTIIEVCNATIHQVRQPTAKEIEDQLRTIAGLTRELTVWFGLGRATHVVRSRA